MSSSEPQVTIEQLKPHIISYVSNNEGSSWKLLRGHLEEKFSLTPKSLNPWKAEILNAAVESDKDKDDDESSDDDDINPRKRAKKRSSAEKEMTPLQRAQKLAKEVTGDQFALWNLSADFKARVCNFKGKVYVDIRKFYSKDGVDKPTPKGAFMSRETWEGLKSIMPQIEEALDLA
eukprot:TRINITY_DN24975_c0_g1_i1.p1 TRINITY_DN24975_c0_g1~~TRINITY_DN24975_c0_g1_i1.p1  ORF type:complete len:186 (-),score=44.40 TRINITY_DN24975_c0_g1_i1:134-661(-)